MNQKVMHPLPWDQSFPTQDHPTPTTRADPVRPFIWLFVFFLSFTHW